MNSKKVIEKLVKIAQTQQKIIEKLSQLNPNAPKVEAAFNSADIQVALGQVEDSSPDAQRGNQGYYSANKINEVITDFANKFSLGTDTKGSVNINCAGGKISFVVQLTAQTNLAIPIAQYLIKKYGADMSARIKSYCAAKNKQVGSATASWITF